MSKSITIKDYNNSIYIKYSERIEELLCQCVPPLEERFRIIEELNTEYLEETGKTLPSLFINKLTDWCLHETLSDKTPYKILYEEYPVLSEHQQKRRDRKDLRTGDCMLDLFRNSHDKKQRFKLYEYRRVTIVND